MYWDDFTDNAKNGFEFICKVIIAPFLFPFFLIGRLISKYWEWKNSKYKIKDK